MEQYIGASLMIKTSKSTLIGVLQSIEERTKTLILNTGRSQKAIDIADICQVEILPEEDSILIQNGQRDSEQPKEEKIQKPLEYVNTSTYNEIIELSDSVYGPSREEIVYSGSRGTLHLFVSTFGIIDKKVIIYTKNGIFSEIGVVLARACLAFNADVTLVSVSPTHRIAKEVFYYQNSGGKISTTRTGQPIVVIADTQVTPEMTVGAEKIIFLGEYQNITSSNQVVVFFGVPLMDAQKFPGNSILCDIGLSPKVFSQYNIKRYEPKLLQRLPKKQA
ncbi:hypothetical protein NEOKW01_0508 [Nematocida sp. AWRm80]|nr:hypothetical protein NEOKW01_0508 [Nematocida sp. AWRm80]